MPGLEPIRSRQRTQNQIPVWLGDVVPCELFFAEVMIIVGIVADQMTRELGQIHGAHQLAGRVGQAIRIDEMRLREADRFRPFVHHVGEAFDGAAQALGHNHAGIVAGIDDDAPDKGFDGNPGIQLHEHLGALGAPGTFRYRQRVRQLDAPVLQPLEQKLQGHQLGHRGRRHWGQAVLFPEDLPVRCIHQQCVLGIGVEGGLRRKRGQRRQ